MPSPALAASLRISCGGWRICDPSSVQSSAIIRRRRSGPGSFQSARYRSASCSASLVRVSGGAIASLISLPPRKTLLVAKRSPSNGPASITCDVTAAARYIRADRAIGASVTVGAVTVQTEREPPTVGELIRFWRTQRRLTQMELALDANLSTKHLSFVETGRSRPSPQLLVHLAQHLDLSIAERNRLLLAGGFAPPYLEHPLGRRGHAAPARVAAQAAGGLRAEPGFDRRRALEPDRVQSSRVASLGRGRPGAPRPTDQHAPPGR